MRTNLVPGLNVDCLDIQAGLRELAICAGTVSTETRFVIEHALQRWARGEEEAAQRGAIDRSFHGINFGLWVRVLAAAMAGAERTADAPTAEPLATEPDR
jgi:hypothetical protein